MSGTPNLPAQQADKFWCETCEGTGMVYQEHQAGCHVGGDFPCPDCDGKGYWTRALASGATQPSAPVAIRRRWLFLPNGRTPHYIGEGTGRNKKDPWTYEPYSVGREKEWRENAEIFQGDAAVPIKTEIEVLCALATPPTGEPLTAPSDLVMQFENAVAACAKLHTEYTGKAMSDAMYDRFATLRDDTIPALRKALAATAAPTESEPALTEAQMEVLMFLWGVGDLDGCGYGDQNPREKGRYWWRKQLQTAFPQIVERHRASLPPHPTGSEP